MALSYDGQQGGAMYRRQETGGFVWDVIKIALGVFIGGLLAAFAYEGIVAWRLEQAAKQVSQALKNQQAVQDQSRLEQERLHQNRQLAAEQQRQKAAAIHAERVAAEKRKEAAWLNFYQPSITCRADPSRGDCADAYIRAKKAFEATYKNQ